MNEQAPRQRKKYKTPDRASLNLAAVNNLDAWLTQIVPKLNGTKITRNDLVNWLIEKKGAALSERELIDIASKFFDPIKALESALAQAKSAAANGEGLDLESIVASVQRPRSRCVSRSKRTPKSQGESRPVDASLMD